MDNGPSRKIEPVPYSPDDVPDREPPTPWDEFMAMLTLEERALFSIPAPLEAQFFGWATRHLADAAHSGNTGIPPSVAGAMGVMAACSLLVWHRDGVPFAKESILTIVKEARRWAFFGGVKGSA